MKSYKKATGTIFKHEILVNQDSDTIIGIDPGLHMFGIGIMQIKKDCVLEVEQKKKKIIYNAHDIAKLVVGYSWMLLKIKAKRGIEEKLLFIFEELSEIFEEHMPQLVVVEDVFVGLNKNSALKLGIARGCILTSIGKHKLKFATIPPKQIKMEVTTKGCSQKEDIQAMFAKILPAWPNTYTIPLDSSDALAAAFCGIKLLSKLQINHT